MGVKIRWKSDKQAHEQYIARRQAEIARQKQLHPPSNPTRHTLEKWMRHNQTL
jgi:hypothetical protein